MNTGRYQNISLSFRAKIRILASVYTLLLTSFSQSYAWASSWQDNPCLSSQYIRGKGNVANLLGSFPKRTGVFAAMSINKELSFSYKDRDAKPSIRGS
jgi:hypothetical protein